MRQYDLLFVLIIAIKRKSRDTCFFRDISDGDLLKRLSLDLGGEWQTFVSLVNDIERLRIAYTTQQEDAI